jgi:signal transduction histidine kinase
VILRSRYPAGAVQVEVADTGPGIPENLQEKIFNFSFTTKERGTGVGLAIVRQAVEIHNGQVDLESESGRGTTLRIRLPSGPSTNSRP